MSGVVAVISCSQYGDYVIFKQIKSNLVIYVFIVNNNRV